MCDEKRDEARNGRDKVAPDRVGIGGSKESLRNEGESDGVNGSCKREYGGNALFR